MEANTATVSRTARPREYTLDRRATASDQARRECPELPHSTYKNQTVRIAIEGRAWRAAERRALYHVELPMRSGANSKQDITTEVWQVDVAAYIRRSSVSARPRAGPWSGSPTHAATSHLTLSLIFNLRGGQHRAAVLLPCRRRLLRQHITGVSA